MEKQVVVTTRAPVPVGPYSQAIAIGDFLFVSGQIGANPATGELEGGVEAQVARALENLDEILTASGASLAQVVKTTVFLDDIDSFETMNQVYAKFFTEDPPARSALEVARLPKGALVEIEAVAFIE